MYPLPTLPTHMVDATVGILLALVAALANAVSYLAIRVGTTEGRTADAILIGLVVNLVVFVPVVAVFYYPDYGLTWRSLLSFVASGVAGTLLGRAFAVVGIDRIGASRATPIFSTNGLVAALLGVALLGEQLTSYHAVGILFVVAGASTISWETTQENPEDLPKRELLLGLAFPVAAAVAYGLDPIFARVGLLSGTPAPVGLLVKVSTALVGFLGYLTLRRERGLMPPLRSRTTRWFVFAGVANSIFLLSFYTALSIVPVSVATPVMISYTFWVVLLSALFVPRHLERITWRLVAASLSVVVGLVFITAFA